MISFRQMDIRQNPTVLVPDDAGGQFELTLLHQQWIAYKALGGLIVDADGEIKKLTIIAFAEMIGIHRDTLHTWTLTIPNFWGLVAEKRRVLSKADRASKVYNGLYLRACKGDPAAVKLWAEIFDGYQPPAQRHDVKIPSGLADLLNTARERRRQDIQEGEVVDGTSSANS